jgi:hypothetical protein
MKRKTDILQFMRRFGEKIGIASVTQRLGKPIRRNTSFALWLGAGLTVAVAAPASANASGDPAAPTGTNNAAGFSPGPISAPSPDKSQYNLFHPTPAALMRDLSADRPDKTDCPQTVDAGHFQIEMDFANLTYDQPNSERGNVTATAFQVAPVSLKAGLLNDADLELVFTPYEWEKTDNHATGMAARASGFDGLSVRAKINSDLFSEGECNSIRARSGA